PIFPELLEHLRLLRCREILLEKAHRLVEHALEFRFVLLPHFVEHRDQALVERLDLARELLVQLSVLCRVDAERHPEVELALENGELRGRERTALFELLDEAPEKVRFFESGHRLDILNHFRVDRRLWTLGRLRVKRRGFTLALENRLLGALDLPRHVVAVGLRCRYDARAVDDVEPAVEAAPALVPLTKALHQKRKPHGERVRARHERSPPMRRGVALVLG